MSAPPQPLQPRWPLQNTPPVAGSKYPGDWVKQSTVVQGKDPYSFLAKRSGCWLPLRRPRRASSSAWRSSAWARRPSAPGTPFSLSSPAFPISSSARCSSSVRESSTCSAIRSSAAKRSALVSSIKGFMACSCSHVVASGADATAGGSSGGLAGEKSPSMPGSRRTGSPLPAISTAKGRSWTAGPRPSTTRAR